MMSIETCLAILVVALTLVAYSDRLISDKLANKLAKYL